MAMEPTVFVIALIGIADITNCVQIEENAAPRRTSLENLNEMIDRLITKTEVNYTQAPAEVTTIIQNTKVADQRQESTIVKQNWLNLSTETGRNTVENPALDKLNSTEYEANVNDSNIFFLNNIQTNKSLEPVKDRNMDIFDKPDGHSRMGYYSDNTNSRPKKLQYNSAALENENMLPWFNANKRFEDIKNLSTGRSFTSNNPIPPGINSPKDQGLGMVVKEEIVFEIEDDKPTESTTESIKIRLHTTTPKPVLSYKPKIKGKHVNITRFSFSPSTLHPQNISGSKINKPMYTELMKAQKTIPVQSHKGALPAITSVVGNNYRISQHVPKHIDNNLKLQAEFRKLNDKINNLEWFLNKTLDKENGTRSHNLQISHKSPKFIELHGHPYSEPEDLRTGRPNVSQPVSERHGDPQVAQVFNSRQGIVENVIPRNNFMTEPLLFSRVPGIDPGALQRRLLLLELAKIAKLNRDMFLMSNTRKRFKYIYPVPVYRRRLILKPLGRVL